MAETPPEVLTAFTTIEEVLRGVGIPHAFMGAAAVLCWGRVRATTDVDCVIAPDPEQWALVERALIDRGFHPGKHVGPAEASDATPDLAVYWSPTNVRVDIFLAKTEFEKAALASARVARFNQIDQHVISPESSVVYKLLASRSKDLADIESIFEARKIAGDHLDWAYIDRWCAEWEISDRLAPWRARYRPA